MLFNCFRASLQKRINNLANRGRLWLHRSTEVARWNGIILSDSRGKKDQTPHFQRTMMASLELIQQVDPRRLRRIQRHMEWIMNIRLPRGGARYVHAIRACDLEFQEPSATFDLPYLIGWYACTLVHEATHGVIRSRDILYTPELKERIERLCVCEERRFVGRLVLINAELAARLPCNFDAREWHSHWASNALKDLPILIKRLFKRR